MGARIVLDHNLTDDLGKHVGVTDIDVHFYHLLNCFYLFLLSCFDFYL